MMQQPQTRPAALMLAVAMLVSVFHTRPGAAQGLPLSGPQCREIALVGSTAATGCGAATTEYSLLFNGVPTPSTLVRKDAYVAFRAMVQNSDNFLAVVLFIPQLDTAATPPLDAVLYVNDPTQPSPAHSTCTRWCTASRVGTGGIRVAAITVLPSDPSFSMGWYHIGVKGVSDSPAYFHLVAHTGIVLTADVEVSGTLYVHPHDEYSPPPSYLYTVNSALIRFVIKGMIQLRISSPYHTEVFLTPLPDPQAAQWEYTFYPDIMGSYMIMVYPVNKDSRAVLYSLSIRTSAQDPTVKTDFISAEVVYMVAFIVAPTLLVTVAIVVIWLRCRARHRMIRQMQVRPAAEESEAEAPPPIYIVYSTGDCEPHFAVPSVPDAPLPKKSLSGTVLTS